MASHVLGFNRVLRFGGALGHGGATVILEYPVAPGMALRGTWLVRA